MHPIEDKLKVFLKDKNIDPEHLKSLGNEFSERLRESVVSRFTKEIEDNKAFSLRMSNIGLSLRQLCLQRDYGRVISDRFAISGFYGVMLEHYLIFLLKAAGVNVQSLNEKVTLDVAGHKLPGELDLIIDGAVWDIKSASDYSFDKKFETYKTLEEDDSFGYTGQIFGYAAAKNMPVGGWIVVHKSKGLIKVVPVPMTIQRAYKEKYLEDFNYKIKYVTANKPPPECTGVVKEYHYKKDTGNLILNRNCEWCEYKDKCHPEVRYLDSVVSTAFNKPKKYYIKLHEKYQEATS